jgi:hypothetical protein
MNKAITDGVVMMPLPFAAVLVYGQVATERPGPIRMQLAGAGFLYPLTRISAVALKC